MASEQSVVAVVDGSLWPRALVDGRRYAGKGIGEAYGEHKHFEEKPINVHSMKLRRPKGRSQW